MGGTFSLVVKAVAVLQRFTGEMPVLCPSLENRVERFTSPVEARWPWRRSRSAPSLAESGPVTPSLVGLHMCCSVGWSVGLFLHACFPFSHLSLSVLDPLRFLSLRQTLSRCLLSAQSHRGPGRPQAPTCLGPLLFSVQSVGLSSIPACNENTVLTLVLQA